MRMSESVFGEIEAQNRARVSRMNSPFPTEAVMAAMSERALTDCQPARYSLGPLWATLRRWRRRFREREQLASMSERELHDLGLSHGDVYAELQKPFWRE
jgi:uncharacterized protein YjiS (DUF1127 family)